jgi:hypothetical protein
MSISAARKLAAIWDCGECNNSGHSFPLSMLHMCIAMPEGSGGEWHPLCELCCSRWQLVSPGGCDRHCYGRKIREQKQVENDRL